MWLGFAAVEPRSICGRTPNVTDPDLLTTDARNRIQLTIGAGHPPLAGKLQLPGAITAICWGRGEITARQSGNG